MSSPPLHISVLGPLEVRVAGAPVELGGRATALLLALAVRRGRPVAAERLADLLWSGGRGGGVDGGRNALQAVVSRTRRALGDGGAALVTRGGSYVLDVPPEAVDAERFEAAVAAARRAADLTGSGAGGAAGAEGTATERLAAALASWRGDPYLEAADDPEATAASSRLRELRLEAIDLHAEAVLAAGGGVELVADLRVAVAEHPLRERTHRSLARALARAGSQPEALEVLAALRLRLRDELGVDPEPATGRLYEALLRQDPAVLPLVDEVPAAEERRAAPRGAGPRPLPVPRTSFVGREQAVAELVASLQDARLVTLTGPGGTGKTRLAVEGLSRLAPPPDDATAFVDLAPVTDPADVLRHVADGLGLDPDPAGGAPGLATGVPRDLAARVREHVAGQDLVVLLDNCEHLVDAAAEAAELLLDASPQVRVVATSREGLRVPGEEIVPLPPLEVPPDASAGPEALLAHDAVRLFVDRARAADPTFHLDAAAAPAVAEICRRLDGLPLALELAAARVRSLPVAVLADRLGDRFRLLTGGRRSVRRQRTLEAVVAWSYDLLDERQRWLFRRLGVFTGPVRLALVEAVATDPPGAHGGPAGVEAADVLPLVAALADRSLVEVDGSGGEPVVRMLETIRAFAEERLVEEDDPGRARTRHAEVLAERARIGGAAIRGPDQLVWLRRLDDELDELRAAFGWWLEADPARAVAMAADLGWYWWLHDHLLEGARWLEVALERAGDAAPAEAAALAAGWLGFLRVFDNRYDEARAAAGLSERWLSRVAEPSPFVRVAARLTATYVDVITGADPHRALEDVGAIAREAEALGEHWVASAGWFTIAGVGAAVGRRDQAVRAAEAAMDASARAGDRWGGFQTRTALGWERLIAGDYEAAREHVVRALPLAEAIGSRGQVRLIRAQHAMVDMLDGDLEAAESRLVGLLAERPLHGRDPSVGIAWNGLGMVRRRSGDAAGAAEAYRRAIAAFEAAGEVLGAAEAAAGLAHAEVARGDLAAAEAAFGAAIRTMEGVSPGVALPGTVPFLHEAAAAVACARGDAERALAHLGRAAALRDAVDAPLVAGERFDVDRIEADARAALPVGRADAALAGGRDRAGLLPPLD